MAGKAELAIAVDGCTHESFALGRWLQSILIVASYLTRECLAYTMLKLVIKKITVIIIVSDVICCLQLAYYLYAAAAVYAVVGTAVVVTAVEVDELIALQ